MTEEFFKEQRAKLVKEFWFLKSKRLYMSAKARVRKIAELDYEHLGIDKNVTLQKFKYDSIKSKV